MRGVLNITKPSTLSISIQSQSKSNLHLPLPPSSNFPDPRARPPPSPHRRRRSPQTNQHPHERRQQHHAPRLMHRCQRCRNKVEQGRDSQSDLNGDDGGGGGEPLTCLTRDGTTSERGVGDSCEGYDGEEGDGGLFFLEGRKDERMRERMEND